MKHKIITHTAAGAAVRAAAKRHGVGLTVKVPRKYQEVEVSRRPSGTSGRPRPPDIFSVP